MEFSHSRILAAFCLSLLLSLFCLTNSYGAGAADVKTTLNEIQASVDAADTTRFEELVNLDAILENGLDVFMSNMVQSDKAAQIPPLLALMFAGVGSQPAVRSLLLEEASAFVRNGIASGAFGGVKGSSANLQGKFAPLFSAASMGRKEIMSLDSVVRDGDGWLGAFTVHDYGNDNDYKVQGYFAEANGRLRLEQIRNLKTLFEEILLESNG